MEARYIAGPRPEGWTAPNPLDPASPPPSPIPLGPGANVASVLTEHNNGWSAEQWGQYVGTGASIAETAGVDLGDFSGVNFKNVFATIAAGAAVGTAIPGLGTIAGAIIGGITAFVTQIWPNLGGSQTWANVGPDVHRWATRYAEAAFIAQREQEGVNSWPTVKAIATDQLIWWLEQYGAVLLDTDTHFYNGLPGDRDWHYINSAGGIDTVAALYGKFGIDLVATKARRVETGQLHATKHIMQYAWTVTQGNALTAGQAGQGGQIAIDVAPDVTPPDTFDPPKKGSLAPIFAGVLLSKLFA